MEHHFSGDRPAYTIGIEEELMILDREGFDLVNAIEELLEDSPEGEIKPELMESVLEISTSPARNTREAGVQLRGLRQQVISTAGARNLAIGSGGTHPFAMWEDQRIAPHARYRDLISALRFVARQEIIFGLHVHVAVDDPDKAIHVANGIRVHVPVLLALSAIRRCRSSYRTTGSHLGSRQIRPVFSFFGDLLPIAVIRQFEPAYEADDESQSHQNHLIPEGPKTTLYSA